MVKRKLNFKLVCAVMIMTVAGATAGCGPNPQEQERIRREAEERGRLLYLTNGCAVCHGKEGRGDGLNAARFYPPPTNFHDPKSYRQGTSRGAMMRTIQNGVPREGSGMAGFNHLSSTDLRDLAIFLESLQVSDQSPTNEEKSDEH